MVKQLMPYSPAMLLGTQAISIFEQMVLRIFEAVSLG